MRTPAITGTWVGYYEYGESNSKLLQGTRTNFILNLKQSNRNFSGECIDLSEDYRNNSTAEVKGFVNKNLISFIKQYPYRKLIHADGRIEIDYDKSHPEIEYTGYYNDSKNSFEGTWLMIKRTNLVGYAGFRSVKKVREYSHSGTWEIERDKI
ncbi:MAG: hypothetical protein ABJB05_07455 [Parafilimonas sp.]